MSWAAILVALVLAFIAWKVIKGMVKFAVIAVLIVGAGYIYLQGSLPV